MKRVRLWSNFKVGQSLQLGITLTEQLFRQSIRFLKSKKEEIYLFASSSGMDAPRLSDIIGIIRSAELVEGKLLYEVDVLDTPGGRILLDMTSAGVMPKIMTTWTVDATGLAPCIRNFSLAPYENQNATHRS